MDEHTLSRETLVGGKGRAFPLSAGQRLRVINTSGGQVVDTWAVVPPSGEEHVSMSHTRTHISKLTPRVGDVLWSNRRREILEVVEDTSPGVHDTLIAACDSERYRLLGHRGDHRNCCENFRDALRAIGIPRDHAPDPLNLFMNIPWSADGSLEFEPATARPGDHVTFRALVDAIVVLSACPMDLNAINSHDVRDVEVRVLAPAPEMARAPEPESARDGAAAGGDGTAPRRSVAS